MRYFGGFEEFILKNPHMIKDSDFALSVRSRVLHAKEQMKFEKARYQIEQEKAKLLPTRPGYEPKANFIYNKFQ